METQENHWRKRRAMAERLGDSSEKENRTKGKPNREVNPVSENSGVKRMRYLRNNLERKELSWYLKKS